MSDLLNSASLVMIPSGYKEDVVYSQIPTDGSGDLSFTRASNGTRVNSAGLVEVCPWNLNTNSDDFATGWSGANRDYLADATTAPNGTTTADKLGATGGTAYYLKVITSSTGQNAFSIYLKYGNRTTQQIYAYASGSFFAQAVFNLQTGVVSSVFAGSATIEDIGNGWYRCTISGSSAGTSIEIGIENIAVSTYTYAWGAQLNIGSTAKPYFPTTDRLNVPRLTYQNGGGGCPSLLLEKQSTNLLTYSEQFDNGAWPKQNLTVTSNATTSPDGTQNADKLVADTTNARHLLYEGVSLSANTYTFTTYAKAGENSFLIMRLDTDSPEVKTWFDLSNGTIGTSQGGSPTITSVGNGWYRCSVQYVSSTTQTLYAVLYTAKTNGGEIFAGNGTDGTYVWGAQLEASSYPTSYIPTTSSSATRVADACYKTGISSLFGTNQGTFFIDFVYYGSEQFCYIFDVTDASNVNRFLMYDSNGSGLFYFYDNGYAVIDAYQLTKGQRYKIGVKYNSSGTIWYVNGVLKGTGTVSFAHQMSQLYLGIRYSITDNTGMTVNESIVFPTALSGTDLIALTTI